jgi:hypothetical protein
MKNKEFLLKEKLNSGNWEIELFITDTLDKFISKVLNKETACENIEQLKTLEEDLNIIFNEIKQKLLHFNDMR